MDLPRLVYRSPYSYKTAYTEQEYTRLLQSGWFATVPECDGIKCNCWHEAKPKKPKKPKKEMKDELDKEAIHNSRV